jgi:hypothetical protein
MPVLAVDNTGGTKNPALQTYQSKAKWAKPLPHAHANFVPAQSWLSYNWIDKDPDLEMVKFAIEESGWTLERIERETEANGHRVSRYTLMAWYYGSTKRPMNSTISSVMAAIGWERPWVKRG